MWNITCGIYTKPRNSQELDKYFGVDVHQEEEMSSFDLILCITLLFGHLHKRAR